MQNVIFRLVHVPKVSGKFYSFAVKFVTPAFKCTREKVRQPAKLRNKIFVVLSKGVFSTQKLVEFIFELLLVEEHKKRQEK